MFSMSAVCPLHCRWSFKKARHRLRELAPVAWHSGNLAFFDVSLERPRPQDVIRPRNHILTLLIRSSLFTNSICPFSSGLCFCLAHSCPPGRPVDAGDVQSLHRRLPLAFSSDLGMDKNGMDLCNIQHCFIMQMI